MLAVVHRSHSRGSVAAREFCRAGSRWPCLSRYERHRWSLSIPGSMWPLLRAICSAIRSGYRVRTSSELGAFGVNTRRH
jgi:hypothetical protein